MLSQKQIDELLALNRRLRALEAEIRITAQRYNNHAQSDMKQASNWIHDYEFGMELVFYEKESFDDAEDICELAQIATWDLECLKELNKSYIGDNQNHTIYGIVDERLSVEPHCWLFHVLYDDIHMSWEEMLKIGEVWVRMKLELQHTEEFNHDR